MTVVVISFVFFLLSFVLVGVLSSRFRSKTTEDYLLAGRNVPAWLASLSAVATNNSGFMFIGQIAFTYAYGVEAIWVMLGWITGDWMAWTLVHPRVRRESERCGANTVSALLGSSVAGPRRGVIALCGLLTFVLLCVYAAAQLKAGSAALLTLFGWSPEMGAILGATIVVIYCFSGGIRASIWTDAAQSIVMILAMMTLLVMASVEVGTPVDIWRNLREQDPKLISWFPADLKFGFLMYLVGWIFGGFGAIGQPHILVRFMAIRSVHEIRRAKWVYFFWFIPFFAASIAVGLYARAYVPDIASSEIAEGLSSSQATELVMPYMARQLLPEVLIGLTLAGLFSATMSTADSQILVCSSAVTQDIFPQWSQSYTASKISTLAVAAISLLIALYAGESVFFLVLIAWSALGAGIGPALMLRLFNIPLGTLSVTLMMLAGVTTVIVWNEVGLDGALFKIFPGMIASFAVWPIGRWLEVHFFGGESGDRLFDAGDQDL